MTEALAIFENKEIRAIEQNGDVWIPLIDLAKAWGISRNTLPELVERNDKLFTGYTALANVTCATPEEPTGPLRCVNEQGLYLIMGRLNAGRLKDPYAGETLLRFQRWVPELIQRYRKKEIVHVAPVVNTIEAELHRARTLAEQTGGDLTAFQAIALKKCGMEDYIPALKAPVIVHGDSGQWMNATDIGRECGLTAQMVNSWLYNHDFVYPEQGIWRLTIKGERHGEEYTFEATSRHKELRIRWHRSILIASGLKRDLSPSQMALPVKAGV